MSDSDDLSKLDTFIKIMRMTEGDNDGQTLVAIRKANRMLLAEKWDWDRLLRGKVKVIADPFNGARVAPTGPTAAPMGRAAPIRPHPATPRPQPPPQPSAAAPNPWPSGQKPQAARPSSQGSYRSGGPAVAPPGPLHFRRNSRDEWCIASHVRIDSQIGQDVDVHKKDGSRDKKVVGPYSEQLSSGHYLYKIANATKWEKKYSDQKVGINDIF